MSSELPQAWAPIKLGKLFEFKYGKGLPQEKRHGSGSVPVYGSNGIIGSHNHAITRGITIIIGRKGSVGVKSICRPSLVGRSTRLITSMIPEGWPPLYWKLFLESLQLGQQEKSSAIPGISRTDVYQVEVALPPVAEQQRIVAKLEKLLGRVETCQQRLTKITALLKRFRQAVLDAAATGKLTVDWRTDRGKTCDAKSELDSYLAAAERHRPRTREAEPTEGHETFTDAVPHGWATPSLDDLFRFIDYRGKTPKKSKSGKRLISAKNIKMGYISEEPIEYVSEKYYEEWMRRGFPKKDDILFVTEGHTMGFAALNNRSDTFALSQRTITLQPWRPLGTHCFFYFIMSPLFQNLVKLNATGSAAVGIKAAKFRGLPIPFPSLSEQKEIVRRVEHLFALADRTEARFVEAKKRLDTLTQAILAKAFRGELVPTEFELAKAEGRSFESAEELLERIESNGDPHTKKVQGDTRQR